MTKRPAKGTRRPVVTDRAITRALAEAARDAVKAHQEAGLPMVVWKNGKVAWVQPEEVAAAIDKQERAAKRSSRKKNGRR